MSRLRKIRTLPFRSEFTDKELLAYFTQDNSKKKRILRLSLVSTFFFLLTGYTILFIYPTVYYLIPLALGTISACVALIAWLILLFSIRPPTDEEYEAWVHNKAIENLRKELPKLNEGHISDEEIDRMVFIRGFILKGTTTAKNYREQDIYWKVGRDGSQHYSINVFRYFHPLENQLAVFIIDVNAVNFRDRRCVLQEFFYADVVAVTTVDEHDTISTGDSEYNYLTQSIQLRISDGKPISATISSKPLDDEKSLEEYSLPGTEDVEDMIRRLRWLLRSNKHKLTSSAGLSFSADNVEEDEEDEDEEFEDEEH